MNSMAVLQTSKNIVVTHEKDVAQKTDQITAMRA